MRFPKQWKQLPLLYDRSSGDNMTSTCASMEKWHLCMQVLEAPHGEAFCCMLPKRTMKEACDEKLTTPTENRALLIQKNTRFLFKTETSRGTAPALHQQRHVDLC